MAGVTKLLLTSDEHIYDTISMDTFSKSDSMPLTLNTESLRDSRHSKGNKVGVVELQLVEGRSDERGVTELEVGGGEEIVVEVEREGGRMGVDDRQVTRELERHYVDSAEATCENSDVMFSGYEEIPEGFTCMVLDAALGIYEVVPWEVYESIQHDYEEVWNGYEEIVCDFYERVSGGYEAIRDDYERVSGGYEAIRDDYERVSGGYEAIRDDYERVKEVYETVEDGYKTVVDDYEAVKEDDYEAVKEDVYERVKDYETVRHGVETVEDGHSSICDDYSGYEAVYDGHT